MIARAALSRPANDALARIDEVTLTTFTGLAAAACTTVAYVPQAVKAWRSRSTKDVSLSMFLLMVTGIALWLAYGLILRDLPLILANAVTLSLAGAILVCKLRFG
jgi:MtN3 and saliva related transmembrane protein